MYNIQIVNIPSPHMNKAENTENSACKSISAWNDMYITDDKK